MGGSKGGATVVRDATVADLDDVVRLEADCLGRDAWSAGLVGAGLRAELPTVGYLVAELGGVGGAVVGHAVTSLAGDVAELQRIAVAERARRHGVASALLAAVVSRAEAFGAERVLLEVREDNVGAIAFYARSGFVELARRRRYYADGATALVLQLDLPGPTGGTMAP